MGGCCSTGAPPPLQGVGGAPWAQTTPVSPQARPTHPCWRSTFANSRGKVRVGSALRRRPCVGPPCAPLPLTRTTAPAQRAAPWWAQRCDVDGLLDAHHRARHPQTACGGVAMHSVRNVYTLRALQLRHGCSCPPSCAHHHHHQLSGCDGARVVPPSRLPRAWVACGRVQRRAAELSVYCSLCDVR